jgi:hypothetical protein
MDPKSDEFLWIFYDLFAIPSVMNTIMHSRNHTFRSSCEIRSRFWFTWTIMLSCCFNKQKNKKEMFSFRVSRARMYTLLLSPRKNKQIKKELWQKLKHFPLTHIHTNIYTMRWVRAEKPLNLLQNFHVFITVSSVFSHPYLPYFLSTKNRERKRDQSGNLINEWWLGGEWEWEWKIRFVKAQVSSPLI